MIAKSQALQTAGQSHVLHALVKMIFKSQALQTAGQSHVLQALVDVLHVLQSLVETNSESQALQTAGRSDVVQALTEIIAKSQALQTAGQSDFIQAEAFASSQSLDSMNLGNSFQYIFVIAHGFFLKAEKVFPNAWQIKLCVDIGQCNLSLKALLFEAFVQHELFGLILQ